TGSFGPYGCPENLSVRFFPNSAGSPTMDTHLFFEGELIDAATNKPVIKVVRQGEGKDLNNESTPMAFETLKKVVDDMATDASMFDVNKKQ
ncbi:DUF3313 family protein, partial [Citrobacter freundii]|uniref:DUF3313 family protein n=1 Tax=Citrobacter freundii TaxID=546 RepID=UPI0024E0B919